MKKSVIILIAVVAVIIIWAISAYNGLVSMDENVSSQWANVETQYQRRAVLRRSWPNIRKHREPSHPHWASCLPLPKIIRT